MDVPPRYHPCVGHLGTLHGWVTKVPWYCVLLKSEQRNPQKKSALKYLTNGLFSSGSSVNNDYSVDRGSFPLLVVLLCCFVLCCIALSCIVLRPLPSSTLSSRSRSSGQGHTRPHYSLTLGENAPQWKKNYIWC